MMIDDDEEEEGEEEEDSDAFCNGDETEIKIMMI